MLTPPPSPPPLIGMNGTLTVARDHATNAFAHADSTTLHFLTPDYGAQVTKHAGSVQKGFALIGGIIVTATVQSTLEKSALTMVSLLKGKNAESIVKPPLNLFLR